MSLIEPVSVAHASLLKNEALGRVALRKASWRLIPLIALGYGIAYMDRVNISFAALQMNRDLHFSASIYGFGAGLFFLSYAACEVPSNLLLYRVGARRWFARIMFSWGLLAIGMMFVAPSESATPVPANATFITCLAKSHAGCPIFWCAAVMSQPAV